MKALEELKKHPDTKDIPVIMCTGIMTTPQDIKVALEAGAVDFVRKPVEAVELIARVQSMLKLSASYRALNLSHETIAKQHQNIVSSINYARRIQASILPATQEISKALPEHFVFYRPRDIVSGDFYWFTETIPAPIYSSSADNKSSILQGFTSSKIIFAVIDCTGHGVPGAFMTLIGNTLLNQIVNEKDIHQPAQILYELEEGLQITLHQPTTDHKIHDGMDISILSIGEEEVTWAGAKHTLIYFQQGEIKEIKGSKFPIGGFLHKNKVFEQHTIKSQEGDMFYMFTDGFIDQFNAERQRYMKKHFRELLCSIYMLPAATQNQLVEKTFEAWKGTEKQLDDVLVAGIRKTV